MGDELTLRIGAREIVGWTSYQFHAELLTPAAGWSCQIGLGGLDRADLATQWAELRRLTRPGGEVHVYMSGEDGSGASLQAVGVIDNRKIGANRRSGTVLQLAGRDVGGYLIDSSASPTLLEATTGLVELARLLVEPWGLPVVTDATGSRDILTGASRALRRPRLEARQARAIGVDPALYTAAAARRARREERPVDEVIGSSQRDRARQRRPNRLLPGDIERLTIAQAKPRLGETVWGFLDRHCKRLGVLPWITARGELVLSSPDWDQEPVGRIVRRLANKAEDPNTVIDGEVADDAGSRFSTITVYGRSFGGDAARSPHSATLTDEDLGEDALPFRRALVLVDPTVTSDEEAARVAKREFRMRMAAARVLEYTVAGHGPQAGRIWGVDTTVDLLDEIAGVEGRFYVVARSLLGDVESGRQTRLRLVPLYSIEL